MAYVFLVVECSTRKTLPNVPLPIIFFMVKSVNEVVVSSSRENKAAAAPAIDWRTSVLSESDIESND